MRHQKPRQGPARAPAGKTAITKATLQAALRAASEGRDEVWVDAACPGLELRSRKAGKVTRTLRAMLHGVQRRYSIGDQTDLPDDV